MAVAKPQDTIVTLPTLPANTWYRFRVEITKLTATSAKVDVSLVELDASGNPTGTPFTGSIADTNALAAASRPDAGYFTPTSMWPSYKSYTSAAAPVDNTCYQVVTTTAPTCHVLALSHTGSGSDLVASPTNSTGCAAGQYVSGETISLSGAAPTTGWQIDSWTGTDDDSSTASTNTVTMPDADHSAAVNYTQNEYNLSYAAGAGGTLTGNTSQTVNYGGDGTAVTAVADTGYHFVKWSDDSTANPRTDTNVTANVSVTANFAINTFSLSYTAGAGGTLTGNTSQTVNYGGDGTAVTAVADTGYHFVKWSDDSTANPRTDTNVTANVSVTANFAINTFSLSYTAGAGGTLTGNTSQTVNYGGDGTAVTAVADTGYHFVKWSDD